jgi:hypothetical protein
MTLTGLKAVPPPPPSYRNDICEKIPYDRLTLERRGIILYLGTRVSVPSSESAPPSPSLAIECVPPGTTGGQHLLAGGGTQFGRRWEKAWTLYIYSVAYKQSCESRRQTISSISRPTFLEIWKVTSLSRSLPLSGKKVSPQSRPLFGFSRPPPAENESLIANR